MFKKKNSLHISLPRRCSSPSRVARLPDDDAATRLPDVTDRLTPSLPTFLPHGPARPRPSLFFTRRCTRSPSYLASMAAKWIQVDTSMVRCLSAMKSSMVGCLFDDKLHAGGVVSLATSSSMVVGLLHRQAQPDLHSTVGYVVACDMLQHSILVVTCFMALGIKLDFAVLQ